MIDPDKLMGKREERLKVALKELGNGKNKIAKSLKAKKIKGNRGYADCCPIAKYLRKTFPKADYIEANFDVISVEFNGEFIDLDTPNPIYDFLVAFDDDLDYDFLEAS